MPIDHNLPPSVRTYRELLNVLPEDMRWHVIEKIMHYTESVPGVQWNKKGDALVRFSEVMWPHVYVRYIERPDCLNYGMLIHYQSRAAWLYRGEITTERDLFGPVWLRIIDELRMIYPVTSRKIA